MSTAELIKKAVEDKIAISLVEELTAERLKDLVKEVTDKKESSYWNAKPFFQQLVQDTIKDIMRDEVSKRLRESEGIIREAVNKVITDSVISRIADSVKVDLKDCVTVSIDYKRSSDD